MAEYNKFNKNEISNPSKYHLDEAYKNLHKAALKAKEFLDYGLESQRKYKEKRENALDLVVYFSNTVNKFYMGTISNEQSNFY